MKTTGSVIAFVIALALGWTFLSGIEGGRPAGGTQEPPLILYERDSPDREDARLEGTLDLDGPCVTVEGVPVALPDDNTWWIEDEQTLWIDGESFSHGQRVAFHGGGRPAERVDDFDFVVPPEPDCEAAADGFMLAYGPSNHQP